MKLKGYLDTLDGVPEAVKPFYVQLEDGKFELEVEGKVPAVKLQEFRNTNTELMRKITDSDTKLAVYATLGEDPTKLADEVKELRGLRKKVDDKDLVEKKGLEEAVIQRTTEMRATFDGQISALKDALERAETQRDEALIKHQRSMVDRAITDAALAHGVQAPAIPDVLHRARDAGWTLNDKGQVVQIANGLVSFGANGADALTPKEWVVGTLKDTAPHFFSTPHGLNANGSSTAGGSRNPWSKDGWSLTEQGRIAMENPGQAKALAAAAGHKLDF